MLSVRTLRNLVVQLHLRNFCYPKDYNRKLLHNEKYFQNCKKISFSNCHTATTKSKDINTSRKIIGCLNFESKEDALPFYDLPIKSLFHIYRTTKNDERNGFCKNRLYYLSSRLNYPPSVLSELVAKRFFIYSLTFEWLDKSLNVLLDFKVPGKKIIKDFWVLKYHYKTIHNRLIRVKESGIDNLSPWMVRCSEDILNRFIMISQDTKNILGDTKSAKIYLANRLNTSPEYIEELYKKIPALQTTRVPKVKMFLDFLIGDGFSVEEIANKPRVLITSQNTVKIRLAMLRELGLKEINLNVLCLSKKNFEKYYKVKKIALKD